MTYLWRMAALCGVAMLAACQSPDATNEAEINAVEAADGVEEDAEVRAQRLQQAADALERDGTRIGGVEGQALRDQAADDRRAADQVIRQGESQARHLDDTAGVQPRR